MPFHYCLNRKPVFALSTRDILNDLRFHRCVDEICAIFCFSTSESGQFLTEVSGQHSRPIFKVKPVQEEEDESIRPFSRLWERALNTLIILNCGQNNKVFCCYFLWTSLTSLTLRSRVIVAVTWPASTSCFTVVLWLFIKRTWPAMPSTYFLKSDPVWCRHFLMITWWYSWLSLGNSVSDSQKSDV